MIGSREWWAALVIVAFVWLLLTINRPPPERPEEPCYGTVYSCLVDPDGPWLNR